MEEKDRPYHEVSSILPLMREEAFEELKRDIEENGLLEPIWIDRDGSVIDGRNRHRACLEIGIQPKFRTWSGDGSLVTFVASMNLKRRHLDATQRAFVAVGIKQALEKEIAEQKREIGRAHAERQWQNQKQETLEDIDLPKIDKPVEAGEPRTQTGEPAPSKQPNMGFEIFSKPIETKTPIVPRKEERSAGVEAAKITGSNHVYIKQAEKIQQRDPEIAKKALAGEIRMKDALQAVRAQERAESEFSIDELARQKLVEEGQSVVAHQGKDHALIAWAEQNNKLLRVDRGTEWGNPFLLNEDGTRDEVCDAYRKFYLPHKPSLLRKIETAKGKVLACWCYPERCHASEIIGEAYGN